MVLPTSKCVLLIFTCKWAVDWLIDWYSCCAVTSCNGNTCLLLVELSGSLILWHLHVTHRPVWADPAIFGKLQPWHFLCTQQARLAILSRAILSVRCSPKEMSLYFQYHFCFVFCWKTQVNIVVPRNVFGILQTCASIDTTLRRKIPFYTPADWVFYLVFAY